MRNLFAALVPRLCVALLFFGSAGTAAAAEGTGPQVYFAGIASTGSAGDTATRLPHVHAYLQQPRAILINQQLLRGLTARPPAHFQLRSAELASLDGNGGAVVMAVAIDRETVVQEHIAGQHKVLFELAAQALFFDFHERQVLFSYPITLQRIELYPALPTAAQIQAVADEVMAGTGPDSLPAALADELGPLTLPSASSRRLQLTEVVIPPALSARFPAGRIDDAMVGHEFSKVLASTLRLPLLPYATGQAIGGAMAARVADGTVYNLTIPAPDYRITLEITDFREKTLSETPAVRQQLYGAFYRVRVEEPLSGKVYFDQSLRNGATRTIPASQDEVDSFAAYYETMLGGFSSFAQASSGGATDWSRQQTGGRAFSNQLKSLKELINSCR